MTVSTEQGEERGESPTIQKSDIARREESVLTFWKEERIFEESLKKPSPKGEYVFYDGPPFATGLPHYGHLLQSFIKDAMPRFRTMQGYHVARRWGWDCHGLPLENIIEAELNIRDKREIEKIGIDVFNEAARVAVSRYADEWKRIIPRVGRFVDMDNDYRTMDATYTESVWWAFKTLHQKGLVYEGFKAMHLCPRCGTTLANFEVAQGYKDIDDYAVTVKLPLIDEPETALLIWTTTPWTLPGNVAAAVNVDAVYVKVRTEKGFVVLAKERVASVLGEGADIVGEIQGKELVGKRYTPPFAYYKDELHKHKTHAWKVYGAAYVTLDSGTGIVHLAPAYGAEDLELAQKEKIPFIQHVKEDGRFAEKVTDFAGQPVKPKGRHMETDAKVIALLEERGLLFAQEKINHSYPHCWRCDTPLLNWASTSWFVNVQNIKKKLSAENAKVAWVPKHVGEGRFANGLLTAPDWAISRSRFWGAPLPVWKHEKTKELKFVGSVDELLSLARRSGNTYTVMRHGEARGNKEGFVNSDNSIENNLTEQGKEEVRASALRLKKETDIDLIVVSPLARTQQTAKIVQDVFNLPESAVMTDARLSETDMGDMNGKSVEEWRAQWQTLAEHFTKRAGNGENLEDIRTRVADFLFEIERRYANKRILIVTHGDPAWMLCEVARRTPRAHFLTLSGREEKHGRGYLPTAQFIQLPFIPYPHNKQFELDLHRPYIDEFQVGTALGGEWKRIPDVFDCWFESGAMPFASNHYPFKKDSGFNPKRLFGLLPKGYPADFIAESIDQTRGWFYSLIVLGVGLFGRSPYKAVITNGLVLAQDGRKMSKKLKNYPDPMEVVDQFGADALRYYLLSSPIIRGEDLNFSLRGVEEVAKKLMMRLANVVSFYDLYANGTPRSSTSTHPLDRWILSRLAELVRDTTRGFESYELDVATRPLTSFIDDLSTWYLRRSRDRFKTDGEEKTQALATLRFVFYTLAHAMNPMMPFFAEHIFRHVREEGDSVSVNLSEWPTAGTVDETLHKDMRVVREVASAALELRERAGLKVRQPLLTLLAQKLPQDTDLRAIIADEVNVREVKEDTTLETAVWLDTTLTPELRDEGTLRDLVRAIQDLRKTEKLTITDRPTLEVVTSAEGKVFIEARKDALMSETGLASLTVTEGEAGEGALPFPLSMTLRR